MYSITVHNNATEDYNRGTTRGKSIGGYRIDRRGGKSVSSFNCAVPEQLLSTHSLIELLFFKPCYNVWEPDRMIDGRLIGISWVGSSKAAAVKRVSNLLPPTGLCSVERSCRNGVTKDRWWLWDCWERLVFGVFDGLIEGILRSVCHSVSL